MDRPYLAPLTCILVAACGSGEAPRPAPQPPAADDEPAAVAPAPPTSEIELAPRDDFAALFEPDTRPEEPAVPSVTALSAPLRVTEVRELLDGGDVFRVRYPRIELPDQAAREALDARVQAAVAAAATTGLGRSQGRCRATLATAELVSVLCELRTASAGGAPSRPDVETLTFRLGEGTEARRVEVEDAFAPMSRVQRAICTVAAGEGNSCLPPELALAPDHLVVRWRPAGADRFRSIDVPYADLAPLLRRDGILAFAASDAPATSAAALAGAPEPCRAWGPPDTLPAIGAAILATGITSPRLLALDAGGGLFRAVSMYPSGLLEQHAAALAAALGAPETVACEGRAVAVDGFRTRGQVPLFASPDAEHAQLEAQVGSIPLGTHAIRFDRVGRGRFATSPHPATWSYVVSEQARGWAYASAVHHAF